jgi:Flp pilus assembly protein TadB
MTASRKTTAKKAPAKKTAPPAPGNAASTPDKRARHLYWATIVFALMVLSAYRIDVTVPAVTILAVTLLDRYCRKAARKLPSVPKIKLGR